MSKQAIVLKRGQVRPLSVLGTEVRFLCDPDRTDHAWSLMEVSLPRDGGPPPHHHEWDEAFVVLEGVVQFTLDAQSITATAGDFLFAPGGTVHGFHGASDGVARLLIFDAPAHAAAFFQQVDEQVDELPRDLPKVLEIAARTGIRFLPPS